MVRFLSKDKLEGFEKYRYNSIDTSILSNYVMHPFWNWCVQFCPVWVAPNLLTFSGFLLTVLNFLLFSYYDYGFHALTKENQTNDSIPNWVWAVTAVNLFVAYTLDGIDGKQARRTGSSGPLGELFDHGLDSYSTVLIPTCLYSIFGRDELSPLRFFFVIWNIFLNFYLTHWEKYNTGVMFLPWGYDFTMLYNSIDTSILSNYVMHPFWNWCVQFCPVWVAPNLLTFSGFLLTVLNFLLFSYYDYGFHALTKENQTNDSIPNWVWAVTAVNLFVAYTLDGIDGKQARRTGSSGPLGELFDHGLDSYSTVLIPTCLYSIFGRDELSPLRFFFVIWNIFLNFYLTHWEKYNTGVMFLPWGYDFTMLGSCVLLLVTSRTGPLFWHTALPGGLTPGVVFEFVLYFSAIITSQTIILWNIYKSYRDRTGKMRPFPEAVRPLVPLAIFFVLSAVWASCSPNDIINRGPRLFYILTGTIFSNINCRLIVSQMSDTRCEWFNELLVPYALAVLAALSGLSAAAELRMLALLTALASLAHLRYGAGVVQEMCEHFNISCFRIKPKVN